MLYIVSTPIGNLKDITMRAVEVLKDVDLIAAEDTRHTKILLKEYAIDTDLVSYFDYSTKAKLDRIMDQLLQGKSVALVSDAGTPGISDPGYRLINTAYSKGVQVTVIPGATALISALSLSGLPSDRFAFYGFLPVKKVARRNKLKSIEYEEGTIIFYESVHRIVKAIKDIEEVLGDPEIVVVRELTKKFEEMKKGLASELFQYFSERKPKGEFVVLLNRKRRRI